MLDEEQAALMRRCVVAAAPKTLSADQLAGLELVCSGRDGLILLRTGGGKTLLWQLPALQGGGLTVVVVPSVALALDLKESTDKIIAGTGLFCCYDERSENGEAVASAEVPPAASAPSAAEAALRRWRRARGGARRSAPAVRRRLGSRAANAITSAALAPTASTTMPRRRQRR
jgi:hypothetical protein